ncbi:MAG: 3-oxoacyl-[acyl-carrier-protein] reductase [Candidatus Neomarinimicrobiota bacterium]|nr:MAG: 3-oxoacyl-[acyl-carrier-protein] reductase [Candidatus Neomarinimicrobiota bacterium]
MLTDRIAVVTGASRGIGLAIARRLARSGATVYGLSRSTSHLQEAQDSLAREGVTLHACECDVSDFDAVQATLQSITKDHGRIDILVNNAGITRDTLLLRMGEDDWDQVMNVNLKGAFNGIKAVARTMMKNRYGRIINISSVVGLTGNPGQVNYAASKAGLLGLTKSVAKELASRNVTVNCIAPGYIETEMTGQLSDEVKEKLIAQIPLGRIGSGEDVAHLVHFLASEEASYITGQTIAVDGGMTMM